RRVQRRVRRRGVPEADEVAQLVGERVLQVGGDAARVLSAGGAGRRGHGGEQEGLPVELDVPVEDLAGRRVVAGGGHRDGEVRVVPAAEGVGAGPGGEARVAGGDDVGAEV